MRAARAVEVAGVFVWLGMVPALQVVAARPRLTRRSDQVLALAAGGILLLSS